MTRTRLLILLAVLALAPAAQAAPVVQPVPDSDSIDALGCSGSTCLIATGSIENQTAAVAVATDGNPGPLQSIAEVPVLFAAACASPDTCFAVGGNTDNGQVVPVAGGNVQATIDVGDVTELHSIGCASADLCFAGGTITGSSSATGALVPITNGQPGSAQQISGTSDVIDVSCGSPTFCVAVASSGKPGGVPGFFDIVDGKADDFQPVATSGGVGINRIACAGPSRCLGVNVNQAMTLTNGRPGSWSRISAGDGVDAGFPDVDCWSAAQCLGAGGNFPGVVPITGDARGGTPLQLDGLSNLTAVACPAASVCYAGGQTQGSPSGGVIVTLPTGDLQFPAAAAAPPPSCVLPNLRKLTLKKAKKKIKAGHCKLGKVKRKRATKKQRGHVISQKPRKGRYPAGRKVALVVGR